MSLLQQVPLYGSVGVSEPLEDGDRSGDSGPSLLAACSVCRAVPGTRMTTRLALPLGREQLGVRGHV